MPAERIQLYGKRSVPKSVDAGYFAYVVSGQTSQLSLMRASVQYQQTITDCTLTRPIY